MRTVKTGTMDYSAFFILGETGQVQYFNLHELPKMAVTNSTISYSGTRWIMIPHGIDEGKAEFRDDRDVDWISKFLSMDPMAETIPHTPESANLENPRWQQTHRIYYSTKHGRNTDRDERPAQAKVRLQG